MQLLTQILKQINDYVWGLPLICLLLGTGIYFTFKLRLIQLTKLKLAFKCIFKKHEGEGDFKLYVQHFLQQLEQEILSELLQQLQRVVQVLYFGCGYQLSLVWLQNMRKDYLRFVIVKKMKMEKLLVVQCII